MSYLDNVFSHFHQHNPHQPEFTQAVHEVLETLAPLFERESKYEEHSILERIIEPERQIIFRVAWTDDTGKVRVNRGFRIQYISYPIQLSPRSIQRGYSLSPDGFPQCD